jgi:anaerobic ribonucleoside-triphosphate reductase activating protein
MFLRVNHIIDSSKVQGPGERFTIWVQGCSIHCQECSNKDTWEFDKGEEKSIDNLIDDVLKSQSTGLTITGGEPLDQLDAILELCQGVFVFKDIFLCSGYDFKTIVNDVQKKKILNFIDIICSGPFDHFQVCQSEWKGSKNQEVMSLTNRGELLLNLPIYKREYRINKKTGSTLITGFSTT